MRATERIFSKWRNFSEATEASLGGISIRIKILRTPEEQAEGFMFKPEPEDGYGLFFVYKTPQKPSFWMKNVSFDIALICLNEDGYITSMQHLEANNRIPVQIPVATRFILELSYLWCLNYDDIIVGQQLIII
jgi:uncharacterized membrane protein (UPF0127 family)